MPLRKLWNFYYLHQTLEQFATLRPSHKLDKRISYLLDANSEGRITPEELEELDEFLVLDMLMSLLKARAMIRLKDETL